MGAHSNYATLEGDEAMAIVLCIIIAIIGIAMLIKAIIDRHHNAVQQRNDKQVKQHKQAVIRQKMAHQKTLDNFFHNCIEEEMCEITSNPFELNDMAQNLVDTYRS